MRQQRAQMRAVIANAANALTSRAQGSRVHMRTSRGFPCAHAHRAPQINERYLQWGAEAATEMTRRILSQRLDVPLEEVDRRLHELGLLVPDMVR